MTAYRENARDVAGEVDSLAERVKKLEEKPAKEPSKPWTNRQMAILATTCAVILFVAGGAAPSISSAWWPFALGAGISGLLTAAVAFGFASDVNP